MDSPQSLGISGEVFRACEANQKCVPSETELRAAAARFRGPSNSPIRLAIELLLNKDPEKAECTPAGECFSIPAGYDVIELALADIVSLELRQSVIEQLHPGGDTIPAQLLSVTHVAAAAMRSSGAELSSGFNSLPSATVVPSTRAGLARFPFRMPLSLLESAASVRDGLPGHCTELAVTLGVAGSVIGPRQVYFGATTIVAAVKGLQVWLFWSGSSQNLAKVHDYWCRQKPLDVRWAIQELDGLSVLVTSSPVTFVMKPLQIHAVLILETTVHVSGPIWRSRHSMLGVQRMKKFLFMTKGESISGQLSHILDGAEESIGRYTSIIADAAQRASAEHDEEAQKRTAAVLLDAKALEQRVRELKALEK
jgi:hypothetical protein